MSTLTPPVYFAAVTSELQIDAVARGRLTDLREGRLELSLPGTDYRLHLVPAVPADRIATPVGKRIKGVIRAQALRIHAATGGGQFIEPVLGEPRIIAGVINAVDDPGHRVLVRTAVPMWVHWQDGQDLGILRVGQLINCHVQSGTTFEELA